MDGTKVEDFENSTGYGKRKITLEKCDDPHHCHCKIFSKASRYFQRIFRYIKYRKQEEIYRHYLNYG